MGKISNYFVLTAIVVLAAWFVTRQRTLNVLSEGNDFLRSKIQGEELASRANEREIPAHVAARLSEAEEKELLQLRSRIVPLREQMRDTSNRLVILQRPVMRGPPPGTSPDPMYLALKLGLNEQNHAEATKLAAAVEEYLLHPGRKLPDDFESMVQQLPGFWRRGDPDEIARFEAHFEFMGTNEEPEEMADFSLVVREKQAEQLTNGSWARIYIVANGEVRVAGPFLTPDWTSFESSFAESEKAGRKH